MPTYAYACTACEHRFEIVQSFVDDSLTECPECAGRLRKLFNAVGVVFKGTGFYRTDSRNDSRKRSGSLSSGSSAASSDSSAASSDSSKAGTTKSESKSKSESSRTSSKTASTSQGSAA